MNHWLSLSLDYAKQRSYLDDLFPVYPTIPEGIRNIDSMKWKLVEQYFSEQNDVLLLTELLKFKLFPIKDSYVAFLKMDKSAITRNPRTVNRLCGRLYEMGLDEIYRRTSEPKETNRQLGPMFRRWLKTKVLGITPVPISEFTGSTGDAILDASDEEAKKFAREHLSYTKDKGLDFLARINGTYIIGETKFLTDDGGHQNSQFRDAMDVLYAQGVNAKRIAILDGVLYIESRRKMYKAITEKYSEENIMSALVLREFLYSNK